MENEDLDLDVKPAINKDLWLFLIILDIIALCVFGFFLYRHFSGQLFHKALLDDAEIVEAVATPVAQPQVPVEETVVIEQPAPVEEIIAVAVPEEKPVEEVKPVAAAMPDKPAVKKEEKPAATTDVKPEAKQSVFVAMTPKSKYRRVTFRWYGKATSVAIVSGFTNRTPQALKNMGDFWETTLSIAPDTYRFQYIVDGKTRTDPYLPAKDGRSILVVK